MASPHTAGLLAYLLSIYPSATFNPEPEKGMLPPVLDVLPIESAKNAYAFAYEFLPSFMTRFLPPPAFFVDESEFAPIPLPTLTPAQLKAALLKLATPDVLDDSQLPTGTPNLLAFNNATDANGHSWVEEFWADI
jgi:cerevisin